MYKLNMYTAKVCKHITNYTHIYMMNGNVSLHLYAFPQKNYIM